MKFLGSKERNTVFEAGFLGLSLAAEMLKDERQVWSLTISIDSQAKMWATGHRRAIQGQYLVEDFHKQIAAVQSKHPSIEIMLRWMPGHKGITGQIRKPNRWPRGSQVSSAGCPQCAEAKCQSVSQQHARVTGRGSTTR